VRILITDDSAFMRRAITQILSSDPAFEIVGTAVNGQDAIEKVKALKPDLVTMDIEMPVMDGLTALRELRLACPEPRPAVIMCSTLTTQGSHEAIRALRLGAADVVAKDPNLAAGLGGASGMESLKADLISKIKAILDTRRSFLSTPRAPVSPRNSLVLPSSSVDLIVIGSSTGGPPIVEKILAALPAEFPFPIVVAQHMPALFTKSMTQRLDECCALSILHGTEGGPLLPGTATVIEGGKQGRVHRAGGSTKRFALEISSEPASALYKPSVDQLMLSAAKAAGSRTLGVMLTGMGDDGKLGAIAIKDQGGRVITQEGSTCVVYGMPRAVVDAGASAAAMSPDAIAECLAQIAPTREAGTRLHSPSQLDRDSTPSTSPSGRPPTTRANQQSQYGDLFGR
jgi:two-component system, chemotaxis family, protein-glutamate methylesterase/glutaminase